MEEIEWISGGLELLDVVAPLRKRLMAHHAALAPQFADEFAPGRRTSAESELRECAERGGVYIELARAAGRPHAFVAYCISRIDNDGTGEIYSLFVEEEHRNSGLGSKLTEGALAWLKSRRPRMLTVKVMYGNDAALGFYQRHGFQPRTVVLQRK